MKTALNLSETVRDAAVSNYIVPALKSGRTEFSIPIWDLSKDLDSKGFPKNHVPQICSAVQKQQFLREYSLEIVRVDGPPSKQGTSVVVHYRVLRAGQTGSAKSPAAPVSGSSSGGNVAESPRARAHRLMARISGILREEIASYGGAEAFIRWVRSEDEEAR
jgi:hypothetical protein